MAMENHMLGDRQIIEPNWPWLPKQSLKKLPETNLISTFQLISSNISANISTCLLPESCSNVINHQKIPYSSTVIPMNREARSSVVHEAKIPEVRPASFLGFQRCLHGIG